MSHSEDLDFEQIIQFLEAQIDREKAACVIVAEASVDDSSLLGTRDGYLHLIVAFLRLIQGADSGTLEPTELGGYWDDSFKDTMLQLPGFDAWLVGTYLFDHPQALLKAVRRLVSGDEQVIAALDHDPDLQFP